jgi:hypothetical protein
MAVVFGLALAWRMLENILVAACEGNRTSNRLYIISSFVGCF